MPRRREPRRCRPAFTLLEVVLAGVIGVLLLAAVYVAVDYQLNHVRTGREVLEQSLLARAVLTRMGREIQQSVGLFAQQQPGSAAGAAAGGNGSAAGSGASPGGGAAGSPAAGAAAGTVYNQGLLGDASHLVVFLSRVPSEVLVPVNDPSSPVPTGISDLRQVAYWLSDQGASHGLARRETVAVTSNDAITAWQSPPDDAGGVIAEEVQDLRFRYFDGTTWQDSWNATALGPDGTTPLGPPAAVEIRIGIQPATSRPGAAAPALKYYTHRVAIPVANATAPAPAAGNSP